MMQSCDVLIVGGGPAGSTCARKLREAGLDVLILDKKTFPRDKVCAGWITPAVVDLLDLDVKDYSKGRVFQPITGFSTSRMGGPEVETHYGAPVSYGIRRYEFDHYLLSRCGARLQLGETLKTLERLDGRWVANGNIRAPLVVGAGGHFCPVARVIGAKLGSDESVVAAQEVEYEMNQEQSKACLVDGLVPELYFCADLKGYAWCFRKGDYLNIGLGREDNHRLSEHVDAFFRFLKEERKIPSDIPDRFKGHAYLLYNHAPRDVLDDGVLLIGDAAGLAYPQSGEGIRPAIESALMAAHVIKAAQGNYKQEMLEPYRAMLTARFGKRSAGEGMSGVIPQGFKQFLGGKLMATQWFTRHVVLDRWFLHAHAPAINLG